MGKIADIRAGLVAAVAGIEGLSARAYTKDIADVPVLMVGGPEIEYDKTFGRGHDDYTIPMIVICSRVSDEDSQARLDSYLDPYGPLSIKAAVEASVNPGGSLAGVVDDLRVTSTSDYGLHEVGTVEYLAALLMVHVMAPGKA